jgi:hypothetical protein
MGENTSGNFFVITLKFLGFLLLLIFSFGITVEFVKAAHDGVGSEPMLLPAAVFFCFFYYLFIRDLNEPYKAIQAFFFRVPWFAHAVSFLLILTGVVCWALVRFTDIKVDHNIFVFLGGFIMASHLIYVSRDMPRESFVDLVNYLFSFSVYYLIVLVMLGLYFCFIFNFNPIKAFSDGCALTFDLIRNFATR